MYSRPLITYRSLSLTTKILGLFTMTIKKFLLKPEYAITPLSQLSTQTLEYRIEQLEFRLNHLSILNETTSNVLLKTYGDDWFHKTNIEFDKVSKSLHHDPEFIHFIDPQEHPELFEIEIISSNAKDHNYDPDYTPENPNYIDTEAEDEYHDNKHYENFLAPKKEH